MANETSSTVIGWGKSKAFMGVTGANDAMATQLKEVGAIKEDSTTLEMTKGSVLELFGEGHELLDRMEQESSFMLKFTIVKPSIDKVAEFFGLKVVDGKLPLTTTVISEYRSYRIEPLLVGAIVAEIPKATTSVTPKFSTKEGWSIDVEVSSLQPATGAPCTLYPKPAPTPVITEG